MTVPVATIPDEGIAFCMRPHPLVMMPGTNTPAPALDKPFVRTSRMLRVAQLHKYLAMKVKGAAEMRSILTIRVDDKNTKGKLAIATGAGGVSSAGGGAGYQDVVLNADMPLHQIETTLWGGPGSITGSGMPVAEGAAGAVGQSDKDDPNVMTLLYRLVPASSGLSLAAQQHNAAPTNGVGAAADGGAVA